MCTIVPHKKNRRRPRIAKQNKKTLKAKNTNKHLQLLFRLAYGEYQNVPRQKLRRIPNTKKRPLNFFSATSGYGEQKKVPKKEEKPTSTTYGE